MKRTIRRTLALAALVALVAVPTTLPVLAQSGGGSTPTRVQHRQSVLTQVDPTGLYESSIVVTQLLVSGSGSAEVVLEDQATEGLRNLEGFDRPTVSGSTIAWSIPTSPEGSLRRTVADADPAALPIAMTIAYELDGEEVTPSQLVGKSGFLTVTYTVTNLTAEQREVRYFDGQGRPRTATVEVAVPMGGTFSATLDPRFVNVEAPDATAIAGDGSGNTVVNGAFTLFEPAGTSTQSFSWSAFVTDAIVPAAEITILPVSSRTSPSVGSGQAQLEQLIDGFKNITNGGLILNSNLLRLSDGAGALADGLANTAAPGAQALADGLLNTAAPGADALADGLETAATRAPDLASGAYQVADGVKELQYQVFGEDQLFDKLGEAETALQVQLFGPGGNAEGPTVTSPLALAAICGARLPAIATGIGGATAAIGGAATTAGGATGTIGTEATSIGAQVTAIGTAAGTIGTLTADADILAQLANISAALTSIAGSLGTIGTSAGTIGTQLGTIGTNATTIGGLVLGDATVGNATDGIAEVATNCGANQLASPAPPTSSTTSLLYAWAVLGGPQALLPSLPESEYDGALYKLRVAKPDVRRLREGAYAVGDGADALANGIVNTAAPGARRLADGIQTAADGAGQLADGLGAAADGATTIAGGTVALSEALEGQLIAGTTEGAADLSLRLAQLNAADARGIAYEGYPFGVAAGSDATAVYAFEIAGVGGDGGPSSSGLALAALGALALAALLGLALRRKAA